jgi:hypothetical protein
MGDLTKASTWLLQDLSAMRNMTPEQQVKYVKEKGKERILAVVRQKEKKRFLGLAKSYAEQQFKIEAFGQITSPAALKYYFAKDCTLTNETWSYLKARIDEKAATDIVKFTVAFTAAEIAWSGAWAAYQGAELGEVLTSVGKGVAGALGS